MRHLSPRNAVLLLRLSEVSCMGQVVIQGGVKTFTPGGVAQDDSELLQPDSAHNNTFDQQASTFVYLRCQQIGIPLLIVSRFAAYGCPAPRTIYDRMAATGSRIGKHLQQVQVDKAHFSLTRVDTTLF